MESCKFDRCTVDFHNIHFEALVDINIIKVYCDQHMDFTYSGTELRYHTTLEGLTKYLLQHIHPVKLRESS